MMATCEICEVVYDPEESKSNEPELYCSLDCEQDYFDANGDSDHDGYAPYGDQQVTIQ